MRCIDLQNPVASRLDDSFSYLLVVLNVTTSNTTNTHHLFSYDDSLTDEIFLLFLSLSLRVVCISTQSGLTSSIAHSVRSSAGLPISINNRQRPTSVLCIQTTTKKCENENKRACLYFAPGVRVLFFVSPHRRSST